MLERLLVSVPEHLWMNHKDSLSKDILYETRKQPENTHMDYTDDISKKALNCNEDNIILLRTKYISLNQDSDKRNEELNEINY